MVAWGFITHFIIFLNMFDIFHIKSQKKKKTVIAAYGQKRQVQIAQSLLFKDIYGSQNYSNLLTVILNKTDQKNLHSP